MKYFESINSLNKILGNGNHAVVYDKGDYVERYQKTSSVKFGYIKKQYQKVIGLDLTNVVKVYSVKYDDINNYTIITMEKLFDPNFTEIQQKIIKNFIDLIEYNENDFEQAVSKLQMRYAKDYAFLDDIECKDRLVELVSFKPALQQIYNGYKELTQYDIYHSDIKPDNIMIDKQGTYKLIDLYSG